MHRHCRIADESGGELPLETREVGFALFRRLARGVHGIEPPKHPTLVPGGVGAIPPLALMPSLVGISVSREKCERVDNAVGETPFVVIPSDDLHMLPGYTRQRRVKDG